MSIWELERQIEESKLKYNELKNQFEIQRKSLAMIEIEAARIENTLRDKQYKVEFIKKITDLGIGKVIGDIDSKIYSLEKTIDSIRVSIKELKSELKRIESNK